MSLESFARYPLTFDRSPVHRLGRLTAHLGGAAVWAKREDVSSWLAVGGTKTRSCILGKQLWAPREPGTSTLKTGGDGYPCFG